MKVFSTFLLVCCFVVVSTHRKPSAVFDLGIKQEAFDDFISGLITTFEYNLKNGTFFSQDFNFYLNSTSDHANVTTRTSFVQDLKLFSASVNSTIDLVAQSGTVQIKLDYPEILCFGSYSLEGVASSVIIVNGDGPYTIQALNNSLVLSAPLIINSQGYVNVQWPSAFDSNYTIENITFEGIVGEDVIGNLIQDYLAEVGENVFERVHRSGMENFLSLMSSYISYILQTVTIDEILYGSPATSTASTPISISTTTNDPNPSSSTIRPDVVIDTGADLAESGWTIPTASECGYATNLNGFFCDGSPVQIRDPFMGIGFWMSPCPGRCIFHYDNVENGNNFGAIGIRAYYTDSTATSRILVDFEHSSGSSHLEFSSGDYNEIDFKQYGILRRINVTMENNGSNQFAVLDKLTISYA